jgi:hypothetical protein
MVKSDFIGPDFIGVGTERAGTSWIFSMIAHHPQSWVPPLKELHFFDAIDPDVPCHCPRFKWQFMSRLKHKIAPIFKQPNRPEFYKNSFLEYLLWDFYFFCGAMDFSWYQKLFQSKFTKNRISGEYTPAYCNINPSYIEQILTHNPKTKFIMIIRNPAQQLRSSLIQNFVMIEKRDFVDVTEGEMKEWLESGFAQNKSNLKDILQKWSAHSPIQQLFIGAYEQINHEPEKLIGNIYNFLGLDGEFMPDERFYRKKINNLTKPNYIIPDRIMTMINEKCAEDFDFVKENHPELAQYWSTDET